MKSLTNLNVRGSTTLAFSSPSVLVTNGSGLVAAATTTPTELNYLSGVTSNVQTQLNAALASGKVLVSDTPPASPDANALWWESDTGKLFIYYNSAWVEAVVGPAGPIGPSGVLVQATAPTDTTVAWVDTTEANSAVGVPAGGAANQVLAKVSGTDYNTAWTTPATQYAGKNAVINGAFDVWQRGTSFSNISPNTYWADRWIMAYKDAGLTINISQQTFTPGTAPVSGYEGTYYARIANTAYTTNNTYYFGQKIEDVRSFAGQTVTMSYWARVSSGTLTATRVFLNQQFGSGGSAETDNIGATQPTYTTTWTRFTQSVTVPSIVGKTIGTGSNLWVLWQITPNANVTLDVWGVQLEAGSVATAFTRNAPSIQAELAACQRYYWRVQLPGSGSQWLTTGLSVSTSQVYFGVTFPVTMRAIPYSIDYAYPGVSSAATGYYSGTLAFVSNASNANYSCLYYTHTSAALTNDRAYLVGFAGAGYIGFSAEL